MDDDIESGRFSNISKVKINLDGFSFGRWVRIGIAKCSNIGISIGVILLQNNIRPFLFLKLSIEDSGLLLHFGNLLLHRPSLLFDLFKGVVHRFPLLARITRVNNSRYSDYNCGHRHPKVAVTQNVTENPDTYHPHPMKAMLYLIPGAVLLLFAIVAVGTVGGCHHAWQGIIALLVAAGFLFGAYRLIVHAADLFIGI
jgi:hypothetical protein